MTSKKRAHRDDKVPVKKQPSPPETQNLDRLLRQSHLATAIQRARLDPGSLTLYEVLQLQRTIGNRAVGQFLANAAQRQNEPNQENETGLLDPLNLLSRPKPISHHSTAGIVQRKITRTPQVEEKTKNLVDVPIGWLTYADTPTIINGKEFPPTKDTKSVLNPPFYEITKKTSGMGEKDERWVLEKIRADEQKVGYRMILPHDPPWIKEVPWDQACAFIADALSMSIAKFEETMLGKFGRKLDKIKVEFKGRPTDHFFVEMVKHHEEHHVMEQGESIETILKPWDDAINDLEKRGATIEGNSPREAEEKFYEAIGGRIEDIGPRFVDDIKRRGLEFHNSDLGKTGNAEHVEFDVASNTVKLSYSHVSMMIIDYQLRKGYFFPPSWRQ